MDFRRNAKKAIAKAVANQYYRHEQGLTREVAIGIESLATELENDATDLAASDACVACRCTYEALIKLIEKRMP